MTQNEALTILKTGANVFLTGEPGAGKTHTINAYVKYLRAQGIEPAITASTGIAATHIGGMTIHSWSGIGIRDKLDQYELDKIASNEYVAKRIGKTRVLIIDEISMLSPATLTIIEAVCREVKQTNEPFGGMQIVLVGDFFQLPPIVKNSFTNTDDINQDSFFEEEEVGIFAYQSQAWKKLSPIICYLTEQHRQDDDMYLSILSAIRANSVNIDHINKINERQVKLGDTHDNITRLFSHNIDVDRINNNELIKINSDQSTHVMQSSGKEKLVSVLIKGCLSPEKLLLKRGAVVMFTKNNIKDGYVNGTLGEVVDFDSNTRYPIVRTNNGKTIRVEPTDWVVEDNGKIKAQITQIPLRLAWAITVHKSQGMSLDAAVMDLSQVFEYGQGYVALSRVRRLSGLHLLGINEQALKVHPQIIEQDSIFHRDSSNAELAFNQMAKGDVLKMQKHFILACGGVWKETKNLKVSPQESDSKDKSSFEKLREKHPKAYMRWGEEEQRELIDLFNKGKTQSEIGKILGRKTGGIRARLVKLGLIEE
ncbi:MAG: ATP-dependent helicase [Patescibacteria group bacterium]|nr:ATP-dependent helicase [Patescibacteria group bacterium]